MSDPAKEVDSAAQSVVNAEHRAENTVKDNAKIIVYALAGFAALAATVLLFRVL